MASDFVPYSSHFILSFFERIVFERTIFDTSQARLCFHGGTLGPILLGKDIKDN